LVIRAAALMLAAAATVAASPAAAPYPVVRPGRAFAFPTDHGAHPAFRTEWWYVTGWLRTKAGKDLGFQVTFFRTRPGVGEANPSRFAPRQILFAHAALSDPATGHLLHGERAARGGFGVAQARVGDTDVALRDWRIVRRPDGHFATSVATPDFTLTLDLAPRQNVMLQGDRGYSQKGPKPEQASYYYSLPHLAASGQLTRSGTAETVTGEAWLDREWSSDYLGGSATGWDWTGLNLDDGAALMAFRIRRADGGTVWAGGSLRRKDGTLTALALAPHRRGVPGCAAPHGATAGGRAQLHAAAAVRRSGTRCAAQRHAGVLGGCGADRGRARLSRTDRLCRPAADVGLSA
jgi:predicted secreted hydrolase